jgi:nicotinate phosphoribosyltransferase
MFHCTTYDAVKAGKVTDVYFARTREILKAEGLDKRVKAEFIAKSLPRDWTWAVLAGVEEVASLVSGMDLDVRTMAEGTIFRQFFDPGSRSSRSRGCTPTSVCTRRSSSA